MKSWPPFLMQGYTEDDGDEVELMSAGVESMTVEMPDGARKEGGQLVAGEAVNIWELRNAGCVTVFDTGLGVVYGVM